MSGYTAIHGWVADVPALMLCELYTRTGGNTTVGPPSKPTIWRVLTSTDPDAFDAAVGRGWRGACLLWSRPHGTARMAATTRC
ncbi:MAG TPA: hypothetical protein VFM55_01800 [Micromonosporaceae bacterium]|nr:hypothetical protein [Micromonosporaceae bacterium]